MAQIDPHTVISNLKKGDVVQKGSWSYYEIDDLSLTNGLYDHDKFEKGSVPYQQINHKFKSSRSEILKLFGDSKTINFSDVVNAGVGECLEKAVLVQLCAQEGRDSFLINGYLETNGDGALQYHAYNVVFKDGKPYLVDAQNPIKDEDGQLHNFIAPIIGIDSETEFILPAEWSADRKYVIC